jgi:protein-disulfide isomerase
MMRIQFLLLPVAAFMVGIMAIAPAQAQGGGFTDAQKEEMGTIIREYLLKNPKVILDAVDRYRANQEQIEAEAMAQAIKEKAPQIFDDKAHPVVGNPKGDVTIVEFLDYNCGYCKIAFRDIETLINDDKNLRVMFIDMPILSEASNMAARYALAAGKQKKYWEFHSALMKAPGGIDQGFIERTARDLKLDMDKLKKDAEGQEIRAQIEANITLARELGFSGTPGFIIGTQPLRGHYGLEAMRKFVADARKKPE